MKAVWLDVVQVVLKVLVWVPTQVAQKACTAAVMMVIQMAAMKDLMLGIMTVDM